MIIDADLSALEWRVAAELCRDPVMIQEIIDGVDIHTANAIAIFGDAKFRQESKTVSFRSLYGGSAYAFHMDSRMPDLGRDRWEEIVESFYNKYKGLKRWQDNNYKLVCKQGWYAGPTGRRYLFKKEKKYDGSWEYPKPSICNFVVQGTATGDIVPLVMCKVMPQLQALSKDIKLINQVHDSIVIDCPDEFVSQVCDICLNAFESIPKYMKEIYNYDWIVPMAGECKFGNNWSEMTTYEKESC